MATTITALPQELVDQIIDDVGAEDKRAVANCALTCPSWTPRSSKHLLNTVSLYTHHLREFLSQAAASRRLAAHVTELSIAQPLQGEESFDLTPYLHDILRTLPNLRAFALFGERITIRAGLAPAPARKSLTHLRIARSHVEALPELLQLFSHIGALHLDQVYIKAPRTAPAPTGHLHVGTLHFDGTTGMLDVLRPSLDGSSLKSLRLKCDGYFRIDTAPVNAFLRSVGRNLSHFRLDLPLDGWVIAGPERNDLSALAHLHHLQSVEIVSPRRAIRRRGTAVSKSLWQNMQSALAYIPPCVQHVRLYANLHHVQPAILADLDYSQMQSGLAACARLRSIEITLLTEHEGRVVPFGASKAAEVQEAVRARVSERFGRILRLT